MIKHLIFKDLFSWKADGSAVSRQPTKAGEFINVTYSLCGEPSAEIYPRISAFLRFLGD